LPPSKDFEEIEEEQAEELAKGRNSILQLPPIMETRNPS